MRGAAGKHQKLRSLANIRPNVCILLPLGHFAVWTRQEEGGLVDAGSWLKMLGHNIKDIRSIATSEACACPLSRLYITFNVHAHLVQ